MKNINKNVLMDVFFIIFLSCLFSDCLYCFLVLEKGIILYQGGYLSR